MYFVFYCSASCIPLHFLHHIMPVHKLWEMGRLAFENPSCGLFSRYSSFMRQNGKRQCELFTMERRQWRRGIRKRWASGSNIVCGLRDCALMTLSHACMSIDFGSQQRQHSICDRLWTCHACSWRKGQCPCQGGIWLCRFSLDQQNLYECFWLRWCSSLRNG